MTSKNLENLVKRKLLKTERFDNTEFQGMLNSAIQRLKDAHLQGLSDESRFSLAYGAAHLSALAALRWHGYRSDRRYVVFQCLEHTVNFDKAKWRVLDECHKKRNLAEYEGQLDITPELVNELLDITTELVDLVVKLTAD